jgi:hypothetical protein
MNKNIKVITDCVLDILSTDIASCSDIKQIIRETPDKENRNISMDEVIRELLLQNIRIGQTVDIGGYVKFIAWNGAVDGLIKRAHHEINSQLEYNKDYAVWFCLPENIDEEEQSSP